MDTVETSYPGTLKEHAARTLQAAKKAAQESENPQALTLGLFETAVQSHGLKPWAYLAKADEAHFRAGTAKSMPAVSVKATAYGLTLYGHEMLYEMTSATVTEILGVVEPGKLSRLDIAVDFQGLDFDASDAERFVCPAVFRPIYPNAEHPETFQFGKAERLVRVYNKTREVAAKGGWAPERWKPNPDYDPRQDVWRFEAQYRRDALREHGIVTTRQGFDNLGGLLGSALNWCDLRIPNGKSTDRWARDPAWERIAAATFASEALPRLSEEARLMPLHRLIPAIGGYAVSAAALSDDYDFESLWATLGGKVLDHQGGPEAFAEAATLRKLQRLG